MDLTQIILIFLKLRYERIELSSQLWKSRVMAIIPIPLKIGTADGCCPRYPRSESAMSLLFLFSRIEFYATQVWNYTKRYLGSCQNLYLDKLFY